MTYIKYRILERIDIDKGLVFHIQGLVNDVCPYRWVDLFVSQDLVKTQQNWKILKQFSGLTNIYAEFDPVTKEEKVKPYE